MRTPLLALAFLLLAATTFAQDARPAAPDYSRETLMRVFATAEVTAEAEPRVRFREGAVEFTALGLDWIFPTVVGPLSGSVRDDVSPSWPNALSDLGIPLATSGRLVRTSRREVNAELRRIEREERRRARAAVVVKP